jgi:hypothetical protein
VERKGENDVRRSGKKGERSPNEFNSFLHVKVYLFFMHFFQQRVISMSSIKRSTAKKKKRGDIYGTKKEWYAFLCVLVFVVSVIAGIIFASLT